MKKMFIALLIILLPSSTMADMTSISDEELAGVTGQVGLDIALINFNADISIKSISYGDTDVGRVTISNRAVDYREGYINVVGLKLTNIYITGIHWPLFTSGTNTSMLANYLNDYWTEE